MLEVPLLAAIYDRVNSDSSGAALRALLAQPTVDSVVQGQWGLDLAPNDDSSFYPSLAWTSGGRDDEYFLQPVGSQDKYEEHAIQFRVDTLDKTQLTALTIAAEVENLFNNILLTLSSGRMVSATVTAGIPTNDGDNDGWSFTSVIEFEVGT